MPTAFTRRSFVAGAALGSVSVFAKSLRAADDTFIQFHREERIGRYKGLIAPMTLRIAEKRGRAVDRARAGRRGG